MSTKDPHIAMLDAHEKLHQVKVFVRQAIELAQVKAKNGTLTPDDKMHLKAIRAEAIERTRRIQDDLYEELNSHGLKV